VIASRAVVRPSIEGRVRTVAHADLNSVLQGAAAIVHHGGIGTTAQAARAGVPQVIVANRFDQPDNAVRVAQLGLGGAVLRDHPPAKQVLDVLRQVLASRHVAQQVATASGLLRGQDAIGDAASLLLARSRRIMRAAP